MLFLASLIVIALAMGGLALGLVAGRGAPARGCGGDCRCRDGAGERLP